MRRLELVRFDPTRRDNAKRTIMCSRNSSALAFWRACLGGRGSSVGRARTPGQEVVHSIPAPNWLVQC